VFEAAVGQVQERVQASVRDFEMATDKAQVRAGGALAQAVRDLGLPMRQEVRKMLDEFRSVGRQDQTGKGDSRGERRWFSIALAFALALLGFGVWARRQLR
jgi:hypothetical protein